MKDILKVYGDATGQVITAAKSSITFGEKVDMPSKESIRGIMEITNEGGAGTYLGLPECFRSSKADLLGYIHDSLRTRVTGWFACTLSLGGKETLLKAVALAMPVFVMSCFKLPKSTIKNLTRAMADFWWSYVDHKRKTHWVSWEKMCLPNKLGGMGFKDIEKFNQPLLAKQDRRVLQYPDSLLARLLKSRYFNDVDFLVSSTGTRPSYGWTSIMFGCELLKKGLKKMVGNGKPIRVWNDYWIEDNRARCPWMMNPIINLDLLVTDLIDIRSKTWNREKLEENFFPGDVNLILNLTPALDAEDLWV